MSSVGAQAMAGVRSTATKPKTCAAVQPPSMSLVQTSQPAL